MTRGDLVTRQACCPYCRAENVAFLRSAHQHDVLLTCGACLGVFVVRFEVTVKVTTLAVEGEVGRVEEDLELRRAREHAMAEADRLIQHGLMSRAEAEGRDKNSRKYSENIPHGSELEDA